MDFTYAIVISRLHTFLGENRYFLDDFSDFCNLQCCYFQMYISPLEPVDAKHTLRHPRYDTNFIRIVNFRCECALSLALKFLFLRKNTTFRVSYLPISNVKNKSITPETNHCSNKNEFHSLKWFRR